MPKQTPKKITRWSYSAWQTWKTCAFKFWRTRIMGDKEPQGPALVRGNMVHAKAESFLKGTLYPVPKELQKLKTEYNNLARLDRHLVVEEFWYVDEDMEPVEEKRDAWCTMKMDAALEPCRATNNILYIQDLKTGREYPYHGKQASLYACIGAKRYPESKGVDVEFWYSDGGYSQPYRFSQRRIKADTDFWLEQGDALMSDKKFLPTPTPDGCKWCFLRTDKGGPCNLWKTVL